jgi:hypothetical protein
VILTGFRSRRTGNDVAMDLPGAPDEPEDEPAGPAEERTTLAAAGAPAGDQDLDELLEDPDAPSG